MFDLSKIKEIDYGTMRDGAVLNAIHGKKGAKIAKLDLCRSDYRGKRVYEVKYDFDNNDIVFRNLAHDALYDTFENEDLLLDNYSRTYYTDDFIDTEMNHLTSYFSVELKLTQYSGKEPIDFIMKYVKSKNKSEKPLILYNYNDTFSLNEIKGKEYISLKVKTSLKNTSEVSYYGKTHKDVETITSEYTLVLNPTFPTDYHLYCVIPNNSNIGPIIMVSTKEDIVIDDFITMDLEEEKYNIGNNNNVFSSFSIPRNREISQTIIDNDIVKLGDPKISIDTIFESLLKPSVSTYIISSDETKEIYRTTDNNIYSLACIDKDTRKNYKKLISINNNDFFDINLYDPNNEVKEAINVKDWLNEDNPASYDIRYTTSEQSISSLELGENGYPTIRILLPFCMLNILKKKDSVLVNLNLVQYRIDKIFYNDDHVELFIISNSDLYNDNNKSAKLATRISKDGNITNIDSFNSYFSNPTAAEYITRFVMKLNILLDF